jgi:hypothetical protein
MSVESPLTILDRLDEEIAKLAVELSQLRRHTQDIRYHLGEPVREESKRRIQRQGRFQVGDVVEWKGKSQHRLKTGTVILVVDAHCYPDAEMLKKLPKKLCNVNTRGYYRYEESYVVECEDGQQYWPRVGWLKLVERKNV